MAGLLDLIAARTPEESRQTLADLVRGPQNRLRGLLDSPVSFLTDALNDVVPTGQQAAEQLQRYQLPMSQDYAMGPSGYDNKLKDMALAGLTVYHGSPHKFDKFDMSKIGTGEGAQAYGHGLYFAESPAVATDYATKLSSAGLAKNKLAQYGGDIDAAVTAANERIANYKNLIANGGGGDPRRAQGMLNLAEKDLNDLLAMKSGTLNEAGNLYKVDLPDESIAKMLDWDKPLSQQPEGVLVAVQDLGLPANATGKDAYNALANLARDGAIARGNNAATTLGGSQSAASVDLRGYGIPGIRYLDGGSRSAGSGTSNYVVFDDSLLKILERNGMPVP